MGNGTSTTLVLLPGLDGTGLLFKPLQECLADSIASQVIPYPLDLKLGYESLAERICQSLPDEKPFVLIAESFSGPLALMVASRKPAGLKGVIISASFIHNPHPYIPSGLAPLVRPGLFRLFPIFAQFRALLGRFGSAGLRKLVADALKSVSPAVLAHRIRCVATVNVAAQLRACPVPIFYFRGRHDWVVPAWNIRGMLKLRPDVKVFVVEAPHMVLQTQPAYCAKIVESILSSIAPGHG